MISDLYSGSILDAAASIPAARRLDAPDATAKKISRICGSEIEVDLCVEDGVVTDFGMTAKACALGQASASIVARNIIGTEADALYRLRDEMRAMLKEDAAPPGGERWVALGDLQVIRDYPQRHASTLLIFNAVCDALDQLGLSNSEQE